MHVTNNKRVITILDILPTLCIRVIATILDYPKLVNMIDSINFVSYREQDIRDDDNDDDN